MLLVDLINPGIKVMTYEPDMDLIKTQNELMDSLSVSVKISHGEALHVVVNDLIEKYKSCVKRGDDKYIEAFGVVIKYYLGEEEFNKLIAPKEHNSNSVNNEVI